MQRTIPVEQQLYSLITSFNGQLGMHLNCFHVSAPKLPNKHKTCDPNKNPQTALLFAASPTKPLLHHHSLRDIQAAPPRTTFMMYCIHILRLLYPTTCRVSCMVCMPTCPQIQHNGFQTDDEHKRCGSTLTLLYEHT